MRRPAASACLIFACSRCAVIESPEGQAACLKATADGLPALAGVEPMIVERMGSRYGQIGMTTVTAGSIVGELMLSKGFKIGSQKK